MLFNQNNNRSMKFRLINLDPEELEEIQELIERNGGVVCDNAKFIFTDPKTYAGDEEVFHIKYIRECVRVGHLLELIDYKIGDKGLLGCLMNLFINDNRYSCCFRGKNQECLRMCTGYIPDQKCNSFASDTATMPMSEGMGDTQLSDSMYSPDDTEMMTYTQSQSKEWIESSQPDDKTDAIDSSCVIDEKVYVDFDQNLTDINSVSKHTSCAASPSVSDENGCMNSAGPRREFWKKDLLQNQEQPGSSKVRETSFNSGRDSDASENVETCSSDLESSIETKRPRKRIAGASSYAETVGYNLARCRVLESGSSKTQNSPKVENRCKKRFTLFRNFGQWEREGMISYLIKTNSIRLARGNNVWKQMIADGYLTHRTYQSLLNHFRKSILPNLDQFDMDSVSRKEFEKLKT